MDFLDTPNTPDLAPEAQDGNGAPTESSLLETPVELPPPVTPQLETPQQKFERLEAEASVQPGSKVSSVDGPSELLADIANDIAKEEMLLGEMECEGSMARLPPLPKAVETPSKKDIQRKVAINVGKDLGYDIVGAQDRVPKPIGAVAPNLWAERVKGGTPDPKAAPPKQKSKLGLSSLGLSSLGLKASKMNQNFGEFTSVRFSMYCLQHFAEFRLLAVFAW
jgi:hypothetical protein